MQHNSNGMLEREREITFGGSWYIKLLIVHITIFELLFLRMVMMD